MVRNGPTTTFDIQIVCVSKHDGGDEEECHGQEDSALDEYERRTISLGGGCSAEFIVDDGRN